MNGLIRRATTTAMALLATLALSGCGEGPKTGSASTPAATAPTETYNLKLAHTWPTNLPIFGDAIHGMAEMANKMSNGRINITIDSKNKHKAPFGIFDMVKSGQYDMGHSGSYYWKGKVPNTLYFTSMPFGMTAMEQYAWFYYGDGFELTQKVYAPHNLLSFPGGNTGNQMGGWFQKEINSIEDLQGLKMRIPGFAGEILAKVGAKPTNIPAGELYTALERGTIDALEWVGPSLDLQMGFHKIAPYYYTGWHEPGSELQFMVNKEKWESFPEDIKEILRVAMRVAAYDMYAHSTHESAENWASMKSEYPNIQVKSFPTEVLQAMKDANDELITERAAADPLAREIIESQAAYLKKARAWTRISDQSYYTTMEALN